MIDIRMEMEQQDCPFIDTTEEHDISFSAMHWDFDESRGELETRMVVEGATRDELSNGLHFLRDHSNMHSFTLQKTWKNTAQIRTDIDETDAMARIRAKNGYITGPFYIENGSELWHVGFDTNGAAEQALSELDRNNEFAIISREDLGNGIPQESIQNVVTGLDLIDACRNLTTVEQETLRVAVEKGYFEDPRETTLEELANEFDISAPAVSKNIRRGQQKLVSSAVEAVNSLEE